MGADFLWAVCPANLPEPSYIDTLSTDTLWDLAETEGFFPAEMEDVTLLPDGRIYEPEWMRDMRQQLKDDIKLISNYSRQWDLIPLRAGWAMLTAGMSWGDPPTDVYPMFTRVSALPCFDEFWENWLDGLENPTNAALPSS